MTICEVTELVREPGRDKGEKIRMLRKIRAELLETIHSKQQLLDQIDYLIYEIRKNEPGKQV